MKAHGLHFYHFLDNNYYIKFTIKKKKITLPAYISLIKYETDFQKKKNERKNDSYRAVIERNCFFKKIKKHNVK